MKILMLAFVLVVILPFCQHSAESSNLNQYSDSILIANHRLNQSELNKLIDSALNEGDEMAYNKVSSYYLMNENRDDFLYIALMMANKYSTDEAFFHVYYILNNPRYKADLSNLDLKSRRIALYYLLKSYEMGYETAKYEVEEIFTKQKKAIPQSKDFLNLDTIIK